MKDEIKERLEKGCGRKFEHINGFRFDGDKYSKSYDRIIGRIDLLINEEAKA